jgi:hypothetical protein
MVVGLMKERMEGHHPEVELQGKNKIRQVN